MIFFIVTAIVMTVAILVVYKIARKLELALSLPALVCCGICALLINFLSIPMTPFLTEHRFVVLGAMVIGAAVVITSVNYLLIRKRLKKAAPPQKEDIQPELVAVEDELVPVVNAAILSDEQVTAMLSEEPEPAVEAEPPAETEIPVEAEPVAAPAVPEPKPEPEPVMEAEMTAEPEPAAEIGAEEPEAEHEPEPVIEAEIPEEAPEEEIPEEAEIEAEPEIEAEAEAEPEIEEEAPEEPEAEVEPAIEAEAEAEPEVEEEAPEEPESEVEPEIEAEAEAEPEIEEEAPEEPEAEAEPEIEVEAEAEPEIEEEAPEEPEAETETEPEVEEEAPEEPEAEPEIAPEPTVEEKLEQSKNLDDVLDYAFELKGSSNWDGALKAYTYALEQYRNDSYSPFLVLEIVNIHKDHGHYDDAIQCFYEALDIPAVADSPDMLAEFEDSMIYLEATKEVLKDENHPDMPFFDIPQEYMSKIESIFNERKARSI
ncbi:MJ0042 family finger-like protein [Anaerovibrio sp. JC8]|uniref:hypothetical protein n=1 Tax=Anaerovibrio sp. JC8 TaxID=1240085 RepID=UPI000A0D1E1D|nr:hypothetical protein [Anaerovibrio sp. JC8]ORU01072.1 MJ0042 family finger-like protein [Anaerovibrio sp. JC8]